MINFSSWKKVVTIMIAGILFLISIQGSIAAGIADPTGAGSIEVFVQRALDWATGMIMAVAVLMAIIAAYFFLTAAGNPGKIKKGSDTLLWAVIGLAIIIFASPLLRVVETNVGSDVETTLSNVIGYLRNIGGPIAVVIFIWGSLLYSTGNSKNVETAYRIFLWTSVGVALILVASGIEGFVRYFFL